MVSQTVPAVPILERAGASAASSPAAAAGCGRVAGGAGSGGRRPVADGVADGPGGADLGAGRGLGCRVGATGRRGSGLGLLYGGAWHPERRSRWSVASVRSADGSGAGGSPPVTRTQLGGQKRGAHTRATTTVSGLHRPRARPSRRDSPASTKVRGRRPRRRGHAGTVRRRLHPARNAVHHAAGAAASEQGSDPRPNGPADDPFPAGSVCWR